MAGAFREHVVVPLVNVRDDLFRTLRNRRSIVSVAEFEADKASLLRMLAEFQADLQVCSSLHSLDLGAVHSTLRRECRVEGMQGVVCQT